MERGPEREHLTLIRDAGALSRAEHFRGRGSDLTRPVRSGSTRSDVPAGPSAQPARRIADQGSCCSPNPTLCS